MKYLLPELKKQNTYFIYEYLMIYFKKIYLVGGCLASAGWPYQHDAVADNHGLIELDDLLDHAVFRLQTLGQQRVNDSLLQSTIVMLRQYAAREQIGQDTLHRERKRGKRNLQKHTRLHGWTKVDYPLAFKGVVQ